jgi:hypothetical protein
MSALMTQKTNRVVTARVCQFNGKRSTLIQLDAAAANERESFTQLDYICGFQPSKQSHLNYIIVVQPIEASRNYPFEFAI